MAFSIGFTDDPVWDPGEGAAGELLGWIKLGDFQENFSSGLFEWTQSTYEEQWKGALHSLLNGATKSALITFYVSPQYGHHLEWWPLHRVDELVYVQNHLLLYDQLTRPFLAAEAISFVKDRQTISEDGEKISEWCVGLDDIKFFLAAD
jgi:hypothetical protein